MNETKKPSNCLKKFLTLAWADQRITLASLNQTPWGFQFPKQAVGNQRGLRKHVSGNNFYNDIRIGFVDRPNIIFVHLLSFRDS